MEKIMLSYAGCHCCIGYETQFKNVVDRFTKDFSFYYQTDGIDQGANIDATICLVENAYEKEIDSEEECIHSSHSKNRKYLLNGDSYTQKDASLYACKKKEGDKLYYYIRKTNTKVLADLSQKVIKLSGTDLYNMLVYVFETILSITIEHNGGIQLHGACCTYKGKGFIITGKSGGGKTTLMFNLLKKGGAFHSNDRVAVFRENEKYVAYSIPIPVNVPINMMRTLDKWKDTELVKNAEDNSKIRFLVHEFDKLFEGNMVTRTEVDAILSVNYSEGEPMHEIMKDDGISEYVEVLSPFDENHPKWLPIYDYPDSAEVEEALKIMRESVDIIRLSGNDTLKALEGTHLWR